jgi:hypothetical protein
MLATTAPSQVLWCQTGNVSPVTNARKAQAQQHRPALLAVNVLREATVSLVSMVCIGRVRRVRTTQRSVRRTTVGVSHATPGTGARGTKSPLSTTTSVIRVITVLAVPIAPPSTRQHPGTTQTSLDLAIRKSAMPPRSSIYMHRRHVMTVRRAFTVI